MLTCFTLDPALPFLPFPGDSRWQEMCHPSLCHLQAKSEQQLMGQLPKERLTPGHTFGKVGVDYPGPLLIRLGHTRKPTVVKAYVCIFVCMAVKAVHLELVTELTTEAFIASLRRFVSRRDFPSDIYRDHGTNFTGANRAIAELYKFLSKSDFQKSVIDSCSNQGTSFPTFRRALGSSSQEFQETSQKSRWRCQTHLRRVEHWWKHVLIVALLLLWLPLMVKMLRHLLQDIF